MAGYIMTIDQAFDAALAGGFYYNHGILFIVAIGWAESRWRTDARNTNTNGSIDRGWLQINTIHKDISDADCDDPVKAAAYAFNNLSSLGTSFSPWSAYNSGAYRGPDGITWTAVTKAWQARTLQQQVNTLQAQNDAFASQVFSLQSQLGSANSTIRSLQAQLTSANDQISTLQSQIVTLNSQVSTLQTQLNDCQTTSAQKDTTILSLKGKISRAQADLA